MKLFCDMDGVLADFEARIIEIFKKHPNDIPDPYMWGTLTKYYPDLFYTLNWMPGGKELWNYISAYSPTILTGVPTSMKKAISGKEEWVTKNIGSHVEVITCLKRNKYKYGNPGDILIDDTLHKVGDPWKDMGGIFIHYTDTPTAIKELETVLNGND